MQLHSKDYRHHQEKEPATPSPIAPKSLSWDVLTLHARSRTPHGDSCLAQCLASKSRHIAPCPGTQTTPTVHDTPNPSTPPRCVFTLITRRELFRRPDSSVSVLQELRLERASQKPIVLGKLQYIKKDVEWDLRKMFGTRVDVRFIVIVGHKKV